MSLFTNCCWAHRAELNGRFESTRTKPKTNLIFAGKRDSNDLLVNNKVIEKSSPAQKSPSGFFKPRGIFNKRLNFLKGSNNSIPKRCIDDEFEKISEIAPNSEDMPKRPSILRALKKIFRKTRRNRQRSCKYVECEVELREEIEKVSNDSFAISTLQSSQNIETATNEVATLETSLDTEMPSSEDAIIVQEKIKSLREVYEGKEIIGSIIVHRGEDPTEITKSESISITKPEITDLTTQEPKMPYVHKVHFKQGIEKKKVTFDLLGDSKLSEEKENVNPGISSEEQEEPIRDPQDSGTEPSLRRVAEMIWDEIVEKKISSVGFLPKKGVEQDVEETSMVAPSKENSTVREVLKPRQIVTQD